MATRTSPSPFAAGGGGRPRNLRRRAWIGTTAAIMIALIAMPAAAQVAAAAAEAPEHADNSGQDPTQPVTRFDIRAKYENQPDGRETEFLTLRADKPFQLGGGWKLNTRGDIPIVRSSALSGGALGSGNKIGLGDVLVQGLIIAPSHGLSTVAFGGQLIMPTGSRDQFTSGKWQLVPTAAVVHQLPHISRGTFVALLVRDTFSFAGKDDRRKINVASIQPIFNWQLPKKWFVTFSPEAKFNMLDGWKLFLPFDMTVGKKINARTVVPLQTDVASVDHYQQYDWQLEFRVGFFF